jgi:hypothetical protein
VKLVLAALACTIGCGFQSAASVVGDAAGGSDGSDAAIDGGVAPDTGPPLRTRAGLIGLWEFDETAGTTVADTSDQVPKVPLTVTVGSVTFAGSTMTPKGVAVIASGPAPHLNANVLASRAVTLEAWVMAASADQGSLTAPVVIAGLCSSVNARNVSLLQAGKRWLARVRTTADPNGKPDLISTTDLTPGVMTHLVVVADATQRILYVNGKPDSVDLAPSAPLNWDKAYKMALGNELSQNRQWAGSFALVAMYDRALSAALVELNRLAGPNGH